MSNKSKRRNKISGNRLQKTGDAFLKSEPKSLVQSNPKLSVLVMIIADFLLYYMMIDEAQTLNTPLIVIFTMLSVSALYSFYVYDYQRGLYPIGGTDVPRFIKDKKKYTTVGWLLMAVWGVLLLIIEPIAVPKLFPVLDSTYYQSQILMMVFAGPIMEEIAFRYLLYDRWLKKRYGWLIGFVIASFLFVICHPVTNIQGLVIYWVPTVLFFLVYNEFGLYGSIVIHMVYNMLAL